jgi:hypothetical protein
MSKIRVSASRRKPLQCPVCRDDLDVAAHRACETCAVSTHEECLSMGGGCPTLGCRAAGAIIPTEEANAAARDAILTMVGVVVALAVAFGVLIAMVLA